MNIQMDTFLNKSVNFDGPYYQLIDGRLVESDKRLDVLNPASNAVIAHAPESSRDQIEEAVCAARQAQPDWAALSQTERAAYIAAFADALDAHKEKLITLLTLEQGKPRHSMATVEVEYAIFWVREVAKRRFEEEVIEDTHEHIVKAVQTPVGVVGVLTPWNFPILTALRKLAPCLMAGNTLVLKPSPHTPLSALRCGEIGQSLLPAGVLNIVCGGEMQGQWLAEHPDINKISFAGSTSTGKSIMASSSGNLKRITLELSGNDPAIIMPGTDFEPLIPSLFDAAFGNSGQWCIAIKRLYVHESLYDAFLSRFVDYAKEISVGDGMNPNTDLGPVQNRFQHARFLDLFQEMKLQKLNVPLGGVIDEKMRGNIVPITIVDNPPKDSCVVREETPGPVLAVMKWSDQEAVVRDANDTVYGMAASVWGPDRDEAIAVAQKLEAGTIWVNEIHIQGVDIPFGGHKQSGIGVENGREGREEFTNTRTFMFRKS